jgi:hypothetical protein
LLLSQQVIVTCCSRYGQKWILSLIPRDKRQTHILLLRYKKKKNLVNFSSICRSHVNNSFWHSSIQILLNVVEL